MCSQISRINRRKVRCEMMKLENGFWIDENNNKWECKFYTETNATQLSKTLANCSDCINCSYCSNMTNCNKCSYCCDCSCCTNCSYCRNCSHCMSCSCCSDCIECKKCSCCEGCGNLKDCSYYCRTYCR